MATVHVNQGRLRLAEILSAVFFTSSADIGLFTGPALPDVTTDFASVTPATFPGYAPQGISGGGSLAIDANGNAAQTYGPNTWTQTAPSAPETVLGWYVFDPGASKLIDIKLFDAGPKVFSAPGDSAVVTYTQYLGQLPPPL